MSLSANDLVRELRFLDVRDREYPDQIDLPVRITMCLVQPEKDCQDMVHPWIYTPNHRSSFRQLAAQGRKRDEF
jgi:hypothetical protein